MQTEYTSANGKNSIQTDKGEVTKMKNLRLSATVSAILGFLSVLALIFLFLALSDIANHEEDLTLEWYVAGVCILILSAFTISTLVTLGFLMRYSEFFEGHSMPTVSKIKSNN